jgi:SecD/SecF fusion protein
MGENLRFRTIVVIVLTLVSAWLVRSLGEGKSPLTLGLDIQGGVALRYEFDESQLPDGITLAQTIQDTILIFSNRLDALAVKELSIRPVGDSQIEVSVPGITSAEADAIDKTLASLGRLELRLEAWGESGVDPVAERDRLAKEIEKRVNAGEEIGDHTDFSSITEGLKDEGSGVTFRWIPKSGKMMRDLAARADRARAAADFEPRWDTPDSWVLIRFDPRPGQFFTGEHIARVRPDRDQETGNLVVGFDLKGGKPTAQFAEFTEKNRGRTLTTMLDNRVQSSANIESRIEGSGIIKGEFTLEEVQRLISVIQSGSLSISPTLAHKFTQGPTLGEAAIRRGVNATLLALAIVAGFMLIYYRLNGVIAVAALLCNLLLLVGVMAWLDATLTLPGIAGIVLTIGMAVDANILIAERIREELEKGKTVAQAIKNGFDRAYTTILDANLTTFVTGFFLYQFGTNIIRGFAVTLMIGLATSMLTGVYFSRTFFGWFLARGIKSLSMMRMLASPDFKFLRHARKAYVASAIVIAVGVGLFVKHPDKKYGMDFTGGYETHVRLAQPASQAEILALVMTRYAGPDVVSIDAQGGTATRFQIKIKETDLRAAEVGTAPSGGPADSSRTRDADRFAADVAALFAGRLVPPGIEGLELGEPTGQGHVPVKCSLLFDGDVRKSDLDAALARNLRIESLDGPDSGAKFALAGRFTRPPGSEEAARALLSPSLRSADGSRDVTLSDPMPARSYIGPRTGKQLRDSAIRAMLLSLAAIILYARMRFSQYRYGFAAVAALVHDVLVTLGAFGIARTCGLSLEVDLTVVAAFLTIIGFSINDTIVIFDRIRENLPRSSLPLGDLIERSINQTLSRTVLTSTTVLISVAILYAFNFGQGNSLEGFAFAMIVGVITGTYSTIYIASPLVLSIDGWMRRRKARAEASPPPKALVV